MSMMVSFVLSFFPRDVLDEILKLIESVSEDFPSYSSMPQRHGLKTVLVSCYCQRVVQSSMHQRPGLNARILVSGYCQTVVQCSTHKSTLTPGF